MISTCLKTSIASAHTPYPKENLGSTDFYLNFAINLEFYSWQHLEEIYTGEGRKNECRFEKKKKNDTCAAWNSKQFSNEIS